MQNASVKRHTEDQRLKKLSFFLSTLSFFLFFSYGVSIFGFDKCEPHTSRKFRERLR